jgi:Fur family transcriptional regulator, zinc uptake regulator
MRGDKAMVTFSHKADATGAGDVRRLPAALVPPRRKAYIPVMAHVHHSHSGANLAEAAQSTMQRSGEQWTPMRAAVFDALASFDRPASAYDIAEKVSQEQGRRVAANSVYRILDLFVGANLARRVESANAYVANDHPDCLHDCIFLICDNCGQTTHIDDDRLSGGVRAAAKQAGFAPDRPVIEVRGRCGDCEEA